MKKFLAILMSAVMLFGLSATAFADDGGSPGHGDAPPILEDKAPTGEGKTEDGKDIKVGEWDPKGTDFEDKDEDEVVEDAMNSPVLKDALEEHNLDLDDLTGSSLSSLTIDGIDAPVPVVFLYGDDGNPLLALYYFDGGWFDAEIEETDQDGVYTLIFEGDGTEDGGLRGEVEVTFEDAEEKDK